MLFKIILLPIKLLLRIMPFVKRGDSHATNGFDAFYNNQYGIAIQEFKLAVKKGVSKYDLSSIHNSLGNAYSSMGFFEEAIECYINSLEINPKNHFAYANKGVAYQDLGKYKKAEQCFNEALQLKPDAAEIHESLGILYLYQEQPQKAIEYLEKSKQLNPGLVETRGNLALAYAAIGRFGEADYELKQAMLRGHDNWQEIKSRIQRLKQHEDDPDQITPQDGVNLN